MDLLGRMREVKSRRLMLNWINRLLGQLLGHSWLLHLRHQRVVLRHGVVRTLPHHGESISHPNVLSWVSACGLLSIMHGRGCAHHGTARLRRRVRTGKRAAGSRHYGAMRHRHRCWSRPWDEGLGLGVEPVSVVTPRYWMLTFRVMWVCMAWQLAVWIRDAGVWGRPRHRS